MKRSPLARGTTPLRRTRLRPKRPTPRRREAPRWTAEEWEGQRILILARARFTCECCWRSLLDGVEIHHRVRRRDGGDRLSNLLALTPTCHQRATQNPADAMARGIIVPTHSDPASVPVLYRGEDWSIVDDDGKRHRMGLDPAYRITG